VTKQTLNETKELEAIQCVCTNIKMASRVVGRAYDSAVAEIGLNIIQYSILINVSRYEPISQIQLADHLAMERTTLYRAIDILHREGLLKTESASKGPALNIRLTSKGKTLTVEAKKKWKRLHDSFIKKFGETGLQTLNQMLSETREHFSQFG